MDEKFLQEWSTKLNVPVDKLKQQFEEAKKEMQSHFPNQSPEIIFEKAKLKLKIDHKRQFMSSAKPFNGIVIGYEQPRDPLVNIRKAQHERFEKAKERAAKTGDQSILQSELDNKVVRILDEDEKDHEGNVKRPKGTIIPLWPKLKANGQPSKLAGQDMPEPADSQIQTVYALGTPVGKKEPKGITLELRGSACGQEFHVGKITSFKAIDKSEKDSKIYTLSTNQTEFLPSEDAYLKEGLEKVGITSLITKFFGDFIVDWETINKWVIAKKENPKSEVVPEKYKNTVMILPNAMCVYQNFNPDQKDRIKINLCDTSDNVKDLTVLCLAGKELDKAIDFAQYSRVVAVGRPWVPPPDKDTGEVTFILMTSGMFAYPEDKIPRKDAQKLGDKQVMQDVNPVPPVTPKQPPAVPAEEAEKNKDPWT